LFLVGILVLAGLGALPVRATTNTDVWTGLSATSGNWNDVANWQGGPGQNAPPAPYDTLDFTGSTSLNATNNYAGGTSFDGIIFDASGSAFTLYGNTVLLSGNTNGNIIGVANSNGFTQTINLNLNLDWGYHTINTAGGLNLNGALTANQGGVVDFGSGTVSSTSLTLDPTGLIAGLGGAGLVGNTSLGGGTAAFGTAPGGFTGLATISGGSITAYTYSASQQIAASASGVPIGADDVTALTTGFANAAVVTSVVVANPAGIQMGAPFTGTGVPNGVTVNSISGSTIGLTSFTSTAASTNNYAFATIASETPANLELTATTAVNYAFAGGTSTVFGSNNTYINTILLANNTTAKVVLGNANGGTMVLGSTNAGTGMYVGGIYLPNASTAQGITMGDGATCWFTCGPMSGNPVPGEIIIAINGANTSNEGEWNGVIKDNLSGGKVTVVYTGGGSMYINTTNAYSGGTYMIKGRVQCNTATALGSGPVYIMGGDAEISLQNVGANTLSNSFFISQSSSIEAPQEGAIRSDGTGNIVLAGNFTFNGIPIAPSTAVTFDDRISTSSADTTTFTGQFLGTGTLELYSETGTATFILSNSSSTTPNNWTGGLVIGGTNADTCWVKLGATSQLASNNVFLYALTTGTARLDLNGFSDSIGGLVTMSNNANLQLANLGSGPSTCTIGVGNPSAYFGGMVTNGTAGALSIVKTGTGTQIIGGATPYTGSTAVSNGVLWLTNSSLAANAAITVASGAVLIMTNEATFPMAAGQVWTVNGTMLLSPTALITTGGGASAINMNGGTLNIGPVTGTFSSVNLTNATINIGSISAAGSVFTTTNYSSGGANTYNITNLPPITKYPSTFVLVQATNISGSASTTVTLPVVSPAYSYTIDNTSTEVQLVINNGPIPVRVLTWLGDVVDPNNNYNGEPVWDWDVQNTLNWSASGPPTYFNQFDLPTFNDTAPGTATGTAGTNVWLTTTLTPDSVNVTNNTNLYTFCGPGGLGGATSLLKGGTNWLVVNNTGANNFTGGILAAGGTLLLQDQNDAIGGNLVASNGAQVIVDDSPSYPMTGNTAIYTNSSVQIGSNDYNGALPLGTVALSGGGSLIFDSQNTIDVVNLISGTGTIVQSNQTGVTQIAAVEAGFNGSVAVDQGTLQFGIANELNGPVPITIQNGATLDVNGIVGTNTVAAVQGAGIGGNGAIVNSSGTAAYPAISFITLTGDTYLGGSGRWDLRSGSGTSGSPTLVGLTCAGGVPHNLYKIGANFIGIVACTVDPNLANIDVSAGTLDIEGNTTGLGNPANTLSVEGATLQLYAPTNHLNKNFVFNDGTIVQQASGASVIIGPVTLGTNTFGTAGAIKIETTAGTSITFSNTIGGVGALTLQPLSGIPIILAAADISTNTTSIAGTGSTELVGNAGILYSAINIEQGATLDVSQLTTAFTDTNTVLLDGTLNLGSTIISNMYAVNLDSGTLNVAVNNQTVPAMTVTNLIVSGTTISLTAVPLAATLNHPYPLIKYQNLTDNLGAGVPPNVTFPGAATGSLTVDTANSSIDLTVTSTGNFIWTGGGSPDDNWSDPANWGGTPIAPGDTLVFAGTNGLNNTNDTTPDTSYNEIIFAPGAGPFNLNGNAVEIDNAVAFANQASNPETVSLEFDFSGNTVLNGGSSAAAPLIMGGVLNDAGSANALYLNGYGSISNNFVTSAPATAGVAFFMTNTSANWTLLDGTNATPSTPNTQAWGFLIEGGTFNFGTPTSAPAFVSTPGNGDNDANDNLVGNTSGLIGTFNMVNGSLTLNARLDTGASTSGAVGTVNQTGGTLTINGQFQGDNIGGGTGYLNLSGGTFAVVGNTTFVASRGIGSMTVGGTAVANLGVLDVSRGIELPTQGTVNLNAGGTLSVSQISTATANAAAPVTGATANFNFNGGLLEASGSSATFITDSSSGATLAIPLTVTVKIGGAIINDEGHTITCLEALQHDSTLGVTNDGGLIKLGAGTLTLTGATGLGGAITNTYTGPTVVSNGILAFGTGGSVTNSILINIAPGATLAPSVTLTLPSGQTLEGGGAIAGNLTSSAGSIVTPGYTNATGTLTVSGAVSLAGSTFIKLNGAANDELAASSNMSYGGSLIVTNLPGNTLVAGDTFTLFQAASYSNSFASIILPALSAGLVWQTNLSTSGSISVVTPAPAIPDINSISKSGGNLIFSGTNGPLNGTYYVLTSTNLALPLTSWTRLSTNTFSATGTFSVTNPIVTGGPPSFFVVEVP
jgi:autotransporter-associated beta strand protein